MPASDFIFSGNGKLIIIQTGTTSIDTQDMYSRWKEWTILSDNIKYLQAFRTFGGDPTITGQFAPRYYFLTNGWRVLIQANQAVSFGTNLYTDELNTPFIVSDGSSVSNRNSDAVIVNNGIQETLDFAGTVNYDENSVYSGVIWPTGTEARPVNNIADALSIANTYNLNRIKLKSDITLTQNIYNYRIFPACSHTTFYFNGFNANHCAFDYLTLSGNTSNSEITANQCIISNIENVSGIFETCYLFDKIKIQANSALTLSHCVSIVPGLNSPSIDMNSGNTTSLNIRGYSGGISIFNCDTANSVATIEFISGRANIMSGCTNGLISIRGIAYLNDLSSGTTLEKSALIIPSVLPIDIAEEIWTTSNNSLIMSAGTIGKTVIDTKNTGDDNQALILAGL